MLSERICRTEKCREHELTERGFQGQEGVSELKIFKRELSNSKVEDQYSFLNVIQS